MGSSSGLIIAFVVAVWAAYFVPLVLRRYDDASKNASLDSSGALGRVIARSTAAPSQAPEISQPAPVVAATTRPAARTADRPAARLAAKRRRRTLLTLLALTAVVTVLSALSIIATPWIAVPVMLVAAWLVACRVQVRSELGMGRLVAPRLPRIGRTGKPSISTAAEEEETVIVSGHDADINPGRKHQMEDVPLEVDALDDQIVIAVPSVSTTGEALWDPLPVTLPTYVTKPRAGRTVRTIEFGQAGAWTSGHIEGEDVELPQRDVDAGEQRRAVGH
ncbi:hypothetical protein [Aeromicrobium sp.]|uniref:divisome protein SepX/GlpR n=1 Tax=Aeromicrobium sp. TaxID=1871063 RepID=UPI003C475930